MASLFYFVLSADSEPCQPGPLLTGNIVDVPTGTSEMTIFGSFPGDDYELRFQTDWLTTTTDFNKNMDGFTVKFGVPAP